MEFLKLNGDLLIDDIISKCWHNKYATVMKLAAHTEIHLSDGTHDEGTNIATITTGWRMVPFIGRIIYGVWCSLGDWRALMRQRTNDEGTNRTNPGGNRCGIPTQDPSTEDFSSKKATCEDLVSRGLLHLLFSDEPEQLGFQWQWYRHSN
ncbi:hypothetical protein BO71DRAFT_431785 [Aspergillus ellipticus CBS 707.79]|uniref:Uncharacterized protein n=1 Tax=Aspergillus ellipticus CBS 707.79 TaxID=1448320 RepID=A0A319D5K9_9EURO|nr:hypothetical protein BO71DRAFT_431785 [Aspergillus ellipticus CBS 707.79]